MTAVISYASEEILKFMTSATELNDDSWAAFKDNGIAQGLDECLEAICKSARRRYTKATRTDIQSRWLALA